MAKIFRAPEHVGNKELKGKKTLFLSGSIDLGEADEWQQEVEEALDDLDVVIFNPRRLDFDPKAEYSEDNPYMVEQIEWELKHLELADICVFNFDPKGKAPITLFEMGLMCDRVYRAKVKGIILCPKGYWKRANVIVNAKFYNFEIADDFEDLLKKTKKALS